LIEENGLDSTYAFLGDDQTDEDAFVALKTSGCKNSLSIIVRNEPRVTTADIWIEPPDELIKFLEKWLKAGS